MTIRVLEQKLFVRPMRTRFPFRYGIASMTALPHLFVRLLVDVDGAEQWGVAADHLPPKWFTKDPDQSFRDEVDDMMAAARNAAALVVGAEPSASAFRLWRQVYTQQQMWGDENALPPLLWNFGVSLVERALIDAICRANSISFAHALRSNLFGIHLGEIRPDLDGYQPVDLLPSAPLRTIIARHTVGLTDPLTDREIQNEDRVDDGLPQSLEACIRAYGLTHFKVKISGQPDHDLDRLTRFAAVVERTVSGEYALTLDGNEQYTELDAFRELWSCLARERRLERLLARLLFVEQPLARSVALTDSTRNALLSWTERPPIIIDESDASLESLSRALVCGYVGTSHKNCKGIFKGILNRCSLAQRKVVDPAAPAILSGEDLSNVGPVALLQDLAVAAALGIGHLERNGHHYFRGLSMYDEALQHRVLTNHPDLYGRHAAGFAALQIENGAVRIDSVVDAPFGTAFEVDPTVFTPLHAWRYEQLEDAGESVP